MRTSSVRIRKFRRFSNLVVEDIPATAKLVVIAGPNGTGKSALFDAMLLRYRMTSKIGWSEDPRYYDTEPGQGAAAFDRIEIATHDGTELALGQMYIRSAYRNDPDFNISQLKRQGDTFASYKLQRLIDQDAAVSSNYQRLASRAVEDIFVNESSTTTMGDYREKLIGMVREPLRRLFPDLHFVGVGNPLDHGTFQFNKGTSIGFDYKNLSGGEKAAFDLIVDIVIKRQSYTNAIYCIDEPELHMNTKVQGALLEELLKLIPDSAQLWVATHSIGMMRKSRELYDASPDSVAFLDFGNRNFDLPTVIKPTTRTRLRTHNQ